MNDNEKIITGEIIANAFDLKKGKNGLYITSYGDKNSIGVYNMFLFLADKIGLKNETPN